MTNTEAVAPRISYVKAPVAKINYTKPGRETGSVKLSLTPELSEVWLTGPRTGQRVQNNRG
jgi:hypothetical protein